MKPWGSSKVCVTDYNNDGKLDLLVGDMTVLHAPDEGVTDKEFDEHYQKLKDLKNIVNNSNSKSQGEENIEPVYKNRVELLKLRTSYQVGFVWLYLQK